MKQKTFKIIGLVLIWSHIFLNFVMASPALQIGEVTAQSGDSIQIPITLTNQDGTDISALSTDIIIDQNIFSDISTTTGIASEDAGKDIFADFADTETYRIGIISFSNNTTIEEGVVAYLNLTIEASVSDQTITITHTASGSNPDGESISIDAVQGSVVITSGADLDVETPDAYLVLANSTNYLLLSGSVTHVYGCSGENNITLESGALAKLLNFSDCNTITIEAQSGLFTVSRSGATITFEGTDGTIVMVAATTFDQTIVFNDQSLSLIIDSSEIMLGSQVVTAEPVWIE